MRLQPRFAWALALGCLGWQLVARVGVYLSEVGEGQSPWPAANAAAGTAAITALVGVLLLIVGGRGLRSWLLALMVPLTLLPFAVGGPAAPVGLSGMLAAAILLVIRRPVAWALISAVTLTDAALAGLVSDRFVLTSLTRVPMTVAVGLALFAVVRLAQLVTAADDARQRLARAEANAERLRATDRLSAGLGVLLSGLIHRTREVVAASRAHRPAPNRETIGEIAALAQRATAAARQVATARAPRTEPSPARSSPPEPTSYGFAWWISLALIISYCSLPFLNVVWSGGADATTWLLICVAAIGSGALQLYHGTPRRQGADPAGWQWTIAAQVCLVGLVTIVARPADVLVLWFLLAGAVITRASRRWSWLIVLVILGIYGFTRQLPDPDWNGWESAYFAGTLAVAIISVYALCTLPVMAERLHHSRVDLARTAIATERLRFARDVHDLLGFHLSAIALKIDLASRALDIDPAETDRQLREVQGSAERALAEIRSINELAGEITTRSEQVAARSLLAAAGVRVSVEVPEKPVPGLDHLVGIIIREAATNVVRHARARECAIRVHIGPDVLGVAITNDGVLPTPADDDASAGAGTGISNLTARVAAIGGELTAVTESDRFTLTARLPYTSHSAPMQTAGSPGAAGTTGGHHP